MRTIPETVALELLKFCHRYFHISIFQGTEVAENETFSLVLFHGEKQSYYELLR